VVTPPSQRQTSGPQPVVARAGPVSTTQDAARPLPSSPAIPVPSSPPGGSMYPVMPGGRPYSTDLAPSHVPAPQRSPYTADSAPAHSANVMSPVGEQYPHVDWAAAAARPAKAIPPWMLALLFVGALGLALTLTIVIAKIVR